MPLIPRGLGDRLFNTLRERITREVGVDPVQPTSTPPAGQPPPSTTVQPTFTQRLREIVERRLGLPPAQPPPPGQPPGAPPQAPVGPEQQPPEEEEYRGPPRSLEEVKQRIQEAGRQQPPKMVRMTYNNRVRDVEPYSYRYRDADDPHIPLFYGYCHKDQQIESFKLKRIQDIQVTNRPFNPKYVVEF